MKRHKISEVHAVSTSMQTAGGHDSAVSLIAWRLDKRNYVEFMIDEPHQNFRLRQWENGQIVNETRLAFPIHRNVPYEVALRIVEDSSGWIVEAQIDHLYPLSIPLTGNFVRQGKVGFRVQKTTGQFHSFKLFGKKT